MITIQNVTFNRSRLLAVAQWLIIIWLFEENAHNNNNNNGTKKRNLCYAIAPHGSKAHVMMIIKSYQFTEKGRKKTLPYINVMKKAPLANLRPAALDYKMR